MMMITQRFRLTFKILMHNEQAKTLVAIAQYDSLQYVHTYIHNYNYKDFNVSCSGDTSLETWSRFLR